MQARRTGALFAQAAGTAPGVPGPRSLQADARCHRAGLEVQVQVRSPAAGSWRSQGAVGKEHLQWGVAPGGAISRGGVGGPALGGCDGRTVGCAGRDPEWQWQLAAQCLSAGTGRRGGRRAATLLGGLHPCLHPHLHHRGGRPGQPPGHPVRVSEQEAEERR